MARFVVNRAGKKHHAGLTYDGFTELLNIPLRFEMGETDGTGVRSSPLEQPRMTREESLKLGKIAENNLETTIDEFLAMAKGERGALAQIVV